MDGSHVLANFVAAAKFLTSVRVAKKGTESLDSLLKTPERKMQRAHLFLRRLGLSPALSRSISSFGTFTSFFTTSSNPPPPLGLRSVCFATALLLLFQAHEASIAKGGKLAVRETLPDDSAQQVEESACVRQLADVEPETLLVAVAEKMPRADRDIRPFDRAFEQGEEILRAVDRRAATNNRARGVIAGFVLIRPTHPAASRALVGVQRGIFRDVPQHVPAQRFGIGCRHNERPHVAVTLDDCLHWRLVHRAAPGDFPFAPLGVHVAGLPADIGFVGFDFARELVESVRLHSFPNPVEHKPRRLLSCADLFGKLNRGNALFRCREQINGYKPFLQGNFAFTKDCIGFYS